MKNVPWARFATAHAFVPLAVLSAGCAGADPHTLQDGMSSYSTGASAPATEPASQPTDACAVAAEGCPCAVEGTTATCAGPKIHTGNYTSCSPGTRTCQQGSWGPCIGNAVYQEAATLTEDYSSTCPAGTHVSWGAIGLDGYTPGDSYVDVLAQTADTAALLDSAPAAHVARFDGPTNPDWTSADVESVLGGLGSTSATWLRVTLRLSPASQSAAPPMVAEWRVARTCVSLP